MRVIELENATLATLRQMARDLDVQNATRMKKEDLILRIQQVEAERQGVEVRGGILEIMSEGIGFLRSGHYQPGPMMCTFLNLKSGVITCVTAT